MVMATEATNRQWQPIPGSSQELALFSPAQHTLFSGPRGPGKTQWQLMRFRMEVGRGYAHHWKGVLIDREFKDLSDIVDQSHELFAGRGDGARWHNGASAYKWVWPSGEQLMFRHAKKKSDYQQFHGHNIPFVAWNELSKYPTRELYDLVSSSNRASFVPDLHTPKGSDGAWLTPDGKMLPPIPLRTDSTTNPWGPGQMWIADDFIDVAPYGEIVTKEYRIYDPRQRKFVTVKVTQVAIRGNFYENPYLDPIYRARIIDMCERDPAKKAAWVDGVYGAFSGGALNGVWDSAIHVVKPFDIPSNWRVDRGHDWGSTHPFSVLWYAESNGEEFIDGSGITRCVPKGTLFVIREWYGTERVGTNIGIQMSPGDIADGVLIREKSMLESGRVKRTPQPGPADNQISDVTRTDIDTIETTMSDHGVRWTKSDKSKGSRIIGLQLVRDRFENSIKGEGPGVYIFDICPATVKTLKALPRDPEKPDDVDTDSEDHIYDNLRYRVLAASNRFATTISARFAM